MVADTLHTVARRIPKNMIYLLRAAPSFLDEDGAVF